ncbi:hypothetical protein HY449_03015 [Candidatus Pacearchaeota archaeon]|nr:hypothetical protein [Candidatus Pacearchaeota archaeon]
MNLAKKKTLAAKVLGAGKERIVFLNSGLNEIKEAITKQDIRDLKNHGLIIVKERRGRKKVGKRGRRGQGNVKIKADRRKKDYIAATRKLRGYVSYMLEQGNISEETRKDLLKKIRNRLFRSKAHLKEYLEEIK